MKRNLLLVVVALMVATTTFTSCENEDDKVSFPRWGQLGDEIGNGYNAAGYEPFYADSKFSVEGNNPGNGSSELSWSKFMVRGLYAKFNSSLVSSTPSTYYMFNFEQYTLAYPCKDEVDYVSFIMGSEGGRVDELVFDMRYTDSVSLGNHAGLGELILSYSNGYLVITSTLTGETLILNK